ncbi:aldo/keto reductase [Candidatus Bathyarchaeota archaeon]|nr:MAG: aldo/keto reductase [Candidatus Bathyarchaeota archaeon]
MGQRYGRSVEESVSVVRHALDSGINFIDTAESYQTEAIVGRAIRGYDRESLVVSTKKSTSRPITAKDVEASFERSLSRLGTSYVDIYHLHGPTLRDYAFLVKEIIPTLLHLKAEGKIRFLGITERFHHEPQHKMLQRASQDDFWDVMMVGFNMLNQTARNYIFSKTMEKNIGVLIMYAVRRALSQPERLRQCVQESLENNQIDPSDLDQENPLDFLIHPDGGAVSVTDAAYRFCRYEPGTHVILSGTGNIEHLAENIESFTRQPLPESDIRRLKHIFRNVDSITG